jgi:hypothetical protein
MNRKTTYAVCIKKSMANMPTSLNTKKEIDNYYNNAYKKLNFKNKRVPKKKVKKLEEQNTKSNNINFTIVYNVTIINKPQIESQFTKNIKAIYDIILNNKQKLIKKIKYINTNLVKLSFCNNMSMFTKQIITAANQINEINESYSSIKYFALKKL